MTGILLATLRTTGTIVDLVGSSLSADLQTGPLGGQSPLRALLSLTLRRSTGLVGIRSPEQIVALRMNKGRLVSAASSEETLDQALLRHLLEEGELADSPELRTLTSNCQRQGEPLDRALHRQSLVSATTLARGIRAVYAHFVIQATTIENAECVVGPSELIGIDSQPAILDIDLLGTLAGAIRERLQRLYYRDLEAVLAPATAGWLYVDHESEILTAIGCKERHLHTIERTLNGQYRLLDVIRISVLSQNELARLLVVLLLFEVLEVGPCRGEVATEADRDRALLELRGQNHFAQLGAHWSSAQEDLAQARSARVRELRQLEHTDPVAKATRQILEAAWAVVSDRKRRIAYRKELIEATQLAHTAELLAMQGRTADFRGDTTGAIRLLETALELHPNAKATGELALIRHRESK